MTLEQNAFEHIDRLKRCSDENAIFVQLKRFASEFGFEGFLVTGVPDPGERLRDKVILNGWSPSWLERYDRSDYFMIDPVVKHLRSTIKPFQWSKAPIGTVGQRVMDEACEFRMNDGFVVPIIDYLGNQSDISFCAERYELSEREERAVELVSIFAFSEVCARNRVETVRDAKHLNLAPRQLEVLKWMAEGKSNWEIGTILGLTESSVATYAKRIARKLNVTTRTHAVAQGFRAGLLS